jgi:hypothetical protein
MRYRVIVLSWSLGCQNVSCARVKRLHAGLVDRHQPSRHSHAIDIALFLLNNAFFSNFMMIQDGRCRRCLAKPRVLGFLNDRYLWVKLWMLSLWWG